ncbi:MAG: type II toxin-antitoxin system VapC family toxin [Thermoprotei archaeon]|nr:MAG: type II toxin-antitoxin system VapC family toxin [Thermoprotei archaeon]
MEFVPAVTAVTVAELYMGERGGEKLDLVLRRLKFYPLDFESARLAGKIYRALRRRGEPIDFRDVLTGAICIRQGVPLVTRNVRHFKRLEELGLAVMSIEELSSGVAGSRA